MASITCGNCEETHNSVAQVRACYGLQGEVSSAHKRIYLSVPFGEKDAAKECGARWDPDKKSWWITEAHYQSYPWDFKRWTRYSSGLGMLQSRVPEGHYALLIEDVWKFFRVQHGKSGSAWEGNTFIDRQASNEYFPVEMMKERKDLLLRIAEDAKQASVDYGRQLGRCGRCNRDLTDPESIASGIGPICAEKVGWN